MYRWYCRICTKSEISDSRAARDTAAATHLEQSWCGAGLFPGRAEAGDLLHVWTHGPRTTVTHGACMTGDGNLAVRGALCWECVDRPYGQRGGPGLLPDECARCYERSGIWVGNCWALVHIGDRLDCTCTCHDGEIALAAS